MTLHEKLETAETKVIRVKDAMDALEDVRECDGIMDALDDVLTLLQFECDGLRERIAKDDAREAAALTREYYRALL